MQKLSKLSSSFIFITNEENTKNVWLHSASIAAVCKISLIFYVSVRQNALKKMKNQLFSRILQNI